MSTSVQKEEKKNIAVSIMSPPGSPLSGIVEDADEEDNAATPQMPARFERLRNDRFKGLNKGLNGSKHFSSVAYVYFFNKHILCAKLQ